MKLYYDRRASNPIYYAQQGFRNGNKTTTKNVKKIGKHSEMLVFTDDPLSYAKEEIRKLNEEYKKGKVTLDVSIDFAEKLRSSGTFSKSTQLNIGYFFLQQIYHDLRIKDFMKDIFAKSKSTFDADEINRFLTFARILDPQSKQGIWDDLSSYYEQPKFSYHQIFRFMDVLYDNYDKYIEHLFETSNRIVPRDTSVCYFDCTNFYFETECEDSEYVDEVTGEIMKGLRKYGVSKEHRPNPIVQMGLFMDKHGVPISMCINPGSDNENNCAVPLEKKLLKMFDGKKFIYCADAGLGAASIRQFNSMGGRAFVITQSVKMLSDSLKEAVFNDCDYKLLSDDTPVSLEYMKTFDRFDSDNSPLYSDKAYKILNADKLIDVGLYETKQFKNGKIKKVKSKATLQQKIIITFSRKVMEYQRYIRNRQIARAEAMLRSGNPEDLKKGPNDVRRFIKRFSKAKSGNGTVVDSYFIDRDMITEEEKYDGFYAVATNLDDAAQDILEINSQRYKIEDCFRVMKTNFDARPVYHYRPSRIRAHFLICYTALLIYRLLENLLDMKGERFSTDNLLDTLRNMNVVNVQDAYYMSAYTGSKVCTALNGLFPLELDRKYYRPKELNNKIKKISK